jgi:hypothetical protein
MATHIAVSFYCQEVFCIEQANLFRVSCYVMVMNLTFSWPCIVEILIMKPTRYTNFSNLILNKTLHVSDSFSVHHQEFFTVRTAMIYIIQVCWQLASSEISWWWTEELSETYRVLFQNKFEKLVHLVGFIIRINHY